MHRQNILNLRSGPRCSLKISVGDARSKSPKSLLISLPRNERGRGNSKIPVIHGYGPSIKFSFVNAKILLGRWSNIFEILLPLLQISKEKQMFLECLVRYYQGNVLRMFIAVNLPDVFRFNPPSKEPSISGERRGFFELSRLDRWQSIFATASLPRHYLALKAGMRPFAARPHCSIIIPSKHSGSLTPSRHLPAPLNYSL